MRTTALLLAALAALRLDAVTAAGGGAIDFTAVDGSGPRPERCFNLTCVLGRERERVAEGQGQCRAPS